MEKINFINNVTKASNILKPGPIKKIKNLCQKPFDNYQLHGMQYT